MCSTRGCYSGSAGSDWRCALTAEQVFILFLSWLFADDRLHHKCVLKMADVVAIAGVTFVQTSAGDAAAQAVRFFAVAEAVDEGAQLTHVVYFPSYHHFLVDDVGLRQVRSLLHIDKKFPEVSRRHHDGGVELNHVALVQCDVMVRRESPVEVMDDVGRVAASEVWDGDGDLLVVVSQINTHVLLQLLTAAQRGVHGVLIQHPAVE